MNDFNLPAFIRQRRAELDLTTRELADLVGVTASTISKWEHGNVQHLKEDKIRPLADALRVHPLKLFGYSDMSHMKEYVETPIKKIPMYSVHNIDFFNDKNILKFICTDVQADFAVTATKYHEDVIKPHDVLLFSRSFNDLHNKYVLLIDDNPEHPPFMDKCVVIHNKLFLYNDASYTTVPTDTKVIGILTEIRRLV